MKNRIKFITIRSIALASLTLFTSQLAASAISSVKKVSSLTDLQQVVLLDARDLKICQTSSVKDAKCLPANTFHSQKGQLASFYDIGWALGTADLKETDHVLVFADKPQDRNLLAGLLLLAGQHKISTWLGKASDLQKIFGKGAGNNRGILRTHIYSGVMRDNYIAQANEIKILQKRGWRLISESIVNSSNKTIQKPIDEKLIVSGSSPLKNIATFAQLQAEGQHQILLSIDDKRP